MLVFSGQVKAVLSFLLTGSDESTSQPIWHKPSAFRVVYSDASDTVDWAGENNQLCPSVALVPRVFKYAQHCNVQGTLVVPQ